jgi:hypothetical protein
VTARDALNGMKGRLEAATPGPWKAEPFLYGPIEDGRIRVTSPSDSGIHNLAEDVLPNDATFIAAAPTEVARLIGAVEAVLAAHQPTDAVMYTGRQQRMVKVCTGCGTDDGNWQRYPCPTVAAVENALNPKEAQ